MRRCMAEGQAERQPSVFKVGAGRRRINVTPHTSVGAGPEAEKGPGRRAARGGAPTTAGRLEGGEGRGVAMTGGLCHCRPYSKTRGGGAPTDRHRGSSPRWHWGRPGSASEGLVTGRHAQSGVILL